MEKRMQVSWESRGSVTNRRPTVFVSSSVYDKEDMLRQIYDLLATNGYEPWMSFRGSIAVPSCRSAFDNCLHSVEDADFFIGIISPWYGSGVDKDDPNSISITHQEMRKARELKLPRLLLVDDRVVVVRQFLDSLGFKHKEGRARFRTLLASENGDVKAFLKAQFSYLKWPVPYVGNAEAVARIGENFRVINLGGKKGGEAVTVREFMRSAHLGQLANVAFLQDGQLSEPDKVGVLLSAMLNCGGGAVAFGAKLAEGGEAVDISGVRMDEGGVREFERQILLSISPGAPVFVQTVSVEDKVLVVVDVPPGKDPPYASGNIIYALHEGRPEPALSAEIREWVLNSGAETNRWENRAAFANAMDGIERTALERAVREAKESRRKVLDVHADTARLLSDFQMMRDGRLLNAGLVMFGRGVGRWLPQAQVRFVHFGGATADADILFSDLYDGPIGDTINVIRDYIVSHAPQVQVFDSATGNRRQEVAYPVMSVREALVNAFAHRDYESALGGIMVRMFGDRVEISNSGKLPEGVTASALNAGNGVPSRLVNPLIANNLYFRGYMEHVGRGSVLIKDECQKVGTLVTWSTKTRGEVMVTFRVHAARQFIDESINQSINVNNGSAINIVKIQESALQDCDLMRFADLITANPCSRRPELQRLTGFSRGEVQGLLDKLKEVRLVIYLGSKKTGGYYLMRMKEVDFDYKMIIRNCFEAEHSPEHCVHGGCQPEKVRKQIGKLKKDGLIRCEIDTTTDSLNHFIFFGFTERGRELFLENGQVKAIYKV